jgi:hypothetical protein
VIIQVIRAKEAAAAMAAEVHTVLRVQARNLLIRDLRLQVAAALLRNTEDQAVVQVDRAPHILQADRLRAALIHHHLVPAQAGVILHRVQALAQVQAQEEEAQEDNLLSSCLLLIL